MLAKYGLRLFALGYLALLLALPVAVIFYRTFESGFSAAWQSVTAPDALHALWLTLLVALFAVPANAIFGVTCALLLVRHNFPGKFLLSAFIDLPLGVSPVVVGLALILVYGKFGWFGGWLEAHGYQITFALPGMIIATIFISLPFVAREVVPVLQEIGTDQEQAARTLGASAWQTFHRITLPAIRMGVGYGLVLSVARSIGEFGAVSVVSAHILGQTETMTLLVQDRFDNFDLHGAYAASLVLAILALATLFAMNLVNRRAPASGNST